MALLRCTICNIPLFKYRDNFDSVINTCYRCGVYEITRTAQVAFNNYFDTTKKKSYLSGWLRRHQKHVISSNTHKRFKNFIQPSIPERASDLLLYISNLLPSIGQTFSAKSLFATYEHVQNPATEVVQQSLKESAVKFMPMIAESWSQSWVELHYLLYDYLTDSKGYLQRKKDEWSISPNGWSHIDNLKYKNPKSDLCFIAMRYKEDIITFCDKHIEPAITNAGYETKRMDKHPHTNIIDNEMLSLIRLSKFTVVDLTYSSNGAYYEAGFSHGYGVPVIFLCEKSYFDAKKVHFDTNHYSVIKWEANKGEELEKELQFFIEANFGKGTFKT